MNMKRFLSMLFMPILLISVAGTFVPTAQAVTDFSNAADLNGSTSYVLQSSSNASPTGVLQSSVNAPPDAATSKENTPLVSNPFDNDLFARGMQWVMKLFAWLVGVAAVTLDNSVYYTIITMGDYVNHLAAVGTAWHILRDIGNIVLIFGFLAIGITTILSVDWYGGGVKMLPTLLIAAVFLNFSLFISEAVIDVSNLFATQFFTQINGGAPPQPVSFSLESVHNEGISNKILSQLGLQGIYYSVFTTDGRVLNSSSSFLIGFMGIILFMVAAFVMFSLALILIARFVALLFLIIVSPIGFAGLAVPKLESYANKWWGSLFEQAITAPVLLLLLYVALAVITDANFLSGLGSITDATAYTGFVQNKNLPGFAAIILSYLIAMGLLLAVTVFAKRLSAFGSSWATKWAGKATGGYLGGVLGGASLVGRGTFGLAGRGLNSKIIQARAAGGGKLGAVAKTSAFIGRQLENRTYDLRNVKALRSAGGTIAQELGSFDSGFDKIIPSVGSGTHTTAKEAIDTGIKTYKTYKPFSGNWWRDQQKEYEAARKEIDTKATLAGATVPTVPANATSVAAQDELKKMSVDELTQLKDIRGGIDRLVHNLSPEKFNELMKSDKLLSGEKTKLKDSWNQQFASVPAAAIALDRFSTEEVATLGGSTLTRAPVIENLGISEFEAIRRKGNLSTADRRAIYTQMNAIAIANPAYAGTIADYFDPANDPGGGRMRYWNV